MEHDQATRETAQRCARSLEAQGVGLTELLMLLLSRLPEILRFFFPSPPGGGGQEEDEHDWAHQPAPPPPSQGETPQGAPPAPAQPEAPRRGSRQR